jgi:hypothetical protein
MQTARVALFTKSETDARQGPDHNSLLHHDPSTLRPSVLQQPTAQQPFRPAIMSHHPMIGKLAPALTLPSTPSGEPYTLPIGEKVCSPPASSPALTAS